MSTYKFTINGTDYSFDFDNSITASEYLTYDDFIAARPTMSIYNEDQIQEAINISYSLLDAKTNFLVSQVLSFNYSENYSVTNTSTSATYDSSTTYPVTNLDTSTTNVYAYSITLTSTTDDTTTATTYIYTLTINPTDGVYNADQTNKLYRSKDELYCIKQALILQTQYSLNLANDYTQGSGSLASGGLSVSYQRPTSFDRIAEGVLEGLQRARVYALNNALTGPLRDAGPMINPKAPPYYTKEETNSNFLKLYQPKASVGNVATINSNYVVDFQDPSTLSGNNYNAVQIQDPSDKTYKTLDKINNLAWYGDNGSDAVTRNELLETAKAYQYGSSTGTYSAGDIVDYIQEGTDIVTTFRSNYDNNLNYDPFTNNKDNYGWEKIYDDENYKDLSDSVTSALSDLTSLESSINDAVAMVNDLNLSNYVTLDGSQTITGVKTFQGAIYVKNPTGNYNPVTLTHLKTNYVDLASNQDISGLKNFAGYATSPTPTSSSSIYTLTNKNYVDSQIASVNVDTSNFVTTSTLDNYATTAYVDEKVSSSSTGSYSSQTAQRMVQMFNISFSAGSSSVSGEYESSNNSTTITITGVSGYYMVDKIGFDIGATISGGQIYYNIGNCQPDPSQPSSTLIISVIGNLQTALSQYALCIYCFATMNITYLTN